MAVAQTTKLELLNHVYSAKSMRVESLNAEITWSKRKLVALQQQLSSLKSAEALVLQRMNRQMKLDQVSTYLTANRYQSSDPLQMISPTDSPAVPDSRVNNSRKKLLASFTEYEKERDRIGNDIQRITRDIKILQDRILSNQDILNSFGVKSGVSAARDNIARRSYSELYMLLEIHTQYRLLTSKPDGTRSGDKKDFFNLKVETYQKLNQMFSVFAGRNAFVLNGTLKLDFDDPGSDANSMALSTKVEELRLVMKNTGPLDSKIDIYASALIANVNDPFVSKKISSQSDMKRVPPEQQALAAIGKTLSGLVNWFNNMLAPKNPNSTATAAIETQQIKNKTTYSLILPRAEEYANALLDVAAKTQAGLNNIPLCVEPPASTGDAEQKAQQDEAKQDETDGQKLYQQQLSNVSVKVSDQVVASTITNLFSSLDKILTSSPGGASTTTATSTLVVGDVTFTAHVPYGVRVLNGGRNVIDYAQEMWMIGNLSDDDYKANVEKLQEKLWSKPAGPPSITYLTVETINPEYYKKS